jgi:hypothetical protein
MNALIAGYSSFTASGGIVKWQIPAWPAKKEKGS